MATLRQALFELLTNDPTLQSILTGGVFHAENLPDDGGGAGSAPRDPGNVRIKPYAIIRWRASARTNADVQKFRSGQGSVEIYNHQQHGYDIIEQAVAREIALLDDTYLTVSDRQLAHFIYMHESAEIPTKELGLIPCRFARFQLIDFR